MFLAIANFFIPKLVGVIRVALVARVLGPSAYAHVSAILVTLAVIESLTQPGLGAALVQSRDGDDDTAERAADAWGLLFYRGVVLALAIYFAAPAVEAAMDLPGVADYVRLAALIPIATGARSLGMSMALRRLDWRQLARYQLWTGCGELGFLLLALSWSPDAVGVVVGLTATELLRAACSHGLFPQRLRWWPRWARLAAIARFGRWVWMSNVATMVLNQVDKVLSSRWYGGEVLAGYHMTSRVAQMAVSEVALMSGSYLFPKFSALYRSDSVRAVDWFIRGCSLIGWTATAATAVCIAFGDWLIVLLLGSEWLAYAPLLRVAALAMAFGALMAPLIAHAKAVGRPELITLATVVQLSVLIPGLFLASRYFGAVGLAGAAACALAAAVAALATGNARQLRQDSDRRRFVILFTGLYLVLALLAGLVAACPPEWLQSWWLRLPVAAIASAILLHSGRQVWRWRLQGTA